MAKYTRRGLWRPAGIVNVSAYCRRLSAAAAGWYGIMRKPVRRPPSAKEIGGACVREMCWAFEPAIFSKTHQSARNLCVSATLRHGLCCNRLAFGEPGMVAAWPAGRVEGWRRARYRCLHASKSSLISAFRHVSSTASSEVVSC